MANELRAKKSGIAYDIEKKNEERYDLAQEDGTLNAIMVWVNAVLEGDHEHIASTSFKDFLKALSSGVVLCIVLNKLLSEAKMKTVAYQNRQSSPFVAMTNIENFNKGCVSYGVSDTFQSNDIKDGKKGPFLNVVNCLHALGTEANKKGYSITYTGQQSKTLDNY